MGKTKNDEKDKPKSFIMEFWSKIFGFLRKLSVFSLVFKLTDGKIKDRYKFVEKWALGNLIAAFIATLIGYYFTEDFKVISWIILAMK